MWVLFVLRRDDDFGEAKSKLVVREEGCSSSSIDLLRLDSRAHSGVVGDGVGVSSFREALAGFRFCGMSRDRVVSDLPKRKDLYFDGVGAGFGSCVATRQDSRR